VLVCATDAGGAANVARVAALIEDTAVRAWCSRRTRAYFRAHRVSRITTLRPGVCIDRELRRCRPDAILCGTTRYESPERCLIDAARLAKIRSVAVIDDWSNYRARFHDAATGLDRWPDSICVPDQRALVAAIADGVPAETLVVTGSPGLCATCDRLNAFFQRPPRQPACLAGTPRPRILFVSETIASDYGSGTRQTGRLGSFLGFTEHSVAVDLAGALREIGEPCTVVEKLHPAAGDIDGGRAVLAGQRWVVVRSGAIESWLWHADLVVGMRSIALLQARMAGCHVLSYGSPSPIAVPPMRDRPIPIDAASTRDSLVQWLRQHWGPRTHRQIVRPRCAVSAAPYRVLAAVRAE